MRTAPVVPSGDLPSELPPLPDIDEILAGPLAPPAHEDTPVEELATNPPFTALEGEK